ncbi:MAG TPA: prolyl oligopeptidase family serine peptidase [Chloroflexia bacterium]|nr:prolyl oligopeptidase family serine peptidase [Chloroflexia bacterium]
MANIESLLSARHFLNPQLWGDRIYFISNLSGHFSLYAMDYGGSVPEPLLPPDIALQNPELIGGVSYWVYPNLGKIVVSIDKDGDEKYRPMLIPLDGGVPEPAFPQITGARVYSAPGERGTTKLHMGAESLTEALNTSYIGDLVTGELEELYKNKWGSWILAATKDETIAVVGEGYTVGDLVLYLWRKGQDGLQPLYGTPMSERTPGQEVPLSGLGAGAFSPSEKGVLVTNSLVEDTYGIGYIDLEKPGEIVPVEITGTRHTGVGELYNMEHLKDDRYILVYNIDGASWAYEGVFDEDALQMKLEHVICGEGELANGVMNSQHYDKESDRFVLSFSTAASPTQIYSVEGPDRSKVVKHTRERILGIPESQMSKGEDAAFTSHDGLRTSARLYLPSEELGFEGPRPLVYYVHGGPQGQERPNFAWFSMPLIQFLTLNGFAVFVPNVRGSTGYGLSYTKRVDRDWGGQDRLDHVHAMTEVLPKDPRIDVSRAGVIGRSYGGYMTLTLAMRHPELWSAAVDMFGPYDLISAFLERMPETWKVYFYEALGHPVKNRDFLMERSPSTYMNDLKAPMLVIQGANDPRVIEAESRLVVESLREGGKEVEYIVFENEGHDVIKFENKVRCYNAITDFFKKHLKP